ncbi:adrenocorticotropic hormone receptor [Dunckerocampus dactyliophorus]|uniref:adrenocorticotropic hormone receptor n=1 Tax=Dunckerocampus dactyliophorus TaxID=161453 RepID=UPI002406A729|nr:adrenocorticotropic hormone receptor [Dunckerocampus dactyliophorus]
MNTTANTSDCPELSVPAPIFFTIGAVGLMENLLVVVAVIYNRNLHSPMFCFMCSLAGFNTVASLTKTCENVLLVVADEGQLKKEGFSETKLDDVMDSLLCMSFVGSIFSFLAIAADRYISIFHALRYHNIMTMRRTAGVLGTIWTTCGVSAVLMVRFFDSKFIMICFVAFFVLSFAVICFLYVYMFMLARIHARKIASLTSCGGEKGHKRWRGGGVRGALTLTILFGAFVVCWAPFFLHLVIMAVCQTNPYCECYRSLFQLHVLLMTSHALIDPAIYAFRSTELRHTFRKMLLCSEGIQPLFQH